MKSYLLGIDCGLTATKAVLYDLQGTQLGIASVPTKTISEQAGYCEIDMEGQWELCCSVVKEVLERTSIRPSDIAAIGTSAYGNGLHMLDTSGHPLGYGFTSMDHRAADLVAAFPEDRLPELKNLTLQNIWDAQPAMLAGWLDGSLAGLAAS